MTTTARRIDYADLERMLRDPTVPESALRPYFEAVPEYTRPMQPAIRIDRERVAMTTAEELRTEGFSAMAYGNDLCRWRRHVQFRARRPFNDLPVLVSEGDSWFQFPILLDDVIDQLGDDYLIWSLDAAGDTLANMVTDYPEYPEALNRFAGEVKAFLFSGAGNDIVGDDADGRSEIAKVLKDYEPGHGAAWYLDTDAYANKLAFVDANYRRLLARVQTDHPDLPVVIHGYDYAIPGGLVPNEWRNPPYAEIDEWIGSGLKERNINDHGLRCAIVKAMIDDLNDLQRKLSGGNVPGGAFPRVYHVDVRGTIKGKDWADELHPTDAGYAKVAAKFRKVLKEAGV